MKQVRSLVVGEAEGSRSQINSPWARAQALRNKLVEVSKKRSLNHEIRVIAHNKLFIENLKNCIAPKVIPSNYLEVSEANQLSPSEEESGVRDNIGLVKCLAGLLLISNYTQSYVQALIFGYEGARESWIYIYLLPLFLVMSILNLVANLFVQRDDNGLILSDLKSIRSHYLASYFAVDLVVLVLQITILAGVWQAAIPAYLLKHVQLMQSVKLFQRSCLTTTSQERIWKLVYLILTNLLVANTVAVIFNLASELPSSPIQPKNWRQVKNMPHIWYIEYGWTFYWSVTTTMTVGYGDIVPVNVREAIIVAFCQLLGGIVYVYNINAIGNVLSEFNLERAQLRKKLNVLRGFFKREGHKFEDQLLKKRIYNNVRNDVVIRNETDRAVENEIFSRLEDRIRMKIELNLREPLLFQTSLFKMFSNQVKRQLCLSLKSRILFNKEDLSYRHRLNKEFMILQRGAAAHVFRRPSDELIINIHRAEDKHPLHFGIRSLLNRVERFTMKVHQVCEIYTIDICVMKGILRSNRKDKLAFCVLKDLEPSLQEFEKDCICKIKRHNSSHCPRYHYAPFRTLVWSKFYRKSDQPRREFKRSERRLHTCFFPQVSKYHHEEEADLLQDDQEEGTRFDINLLLTKNVFNPMLASIKAESESEMCNYQFQFQEKQSCFVEYFPKGNLAKVLALVNRETEHKIKKLMSKKKPPKRLLQSMFQA